MTPPSRDDMSGWAADLRLALGFLTRLPLRAVADEPMRPLGEAARAFPLVGVVVGAIGGAAFLIVGWFGLPAPAAALLALAVTAAATGALHENGLADVADGFWGGATRERRLEIMRESRIGGFGVLALVFGVGLRAAALAALAPGAGFAALIAAGALSRGFLPWLMHRLPLARADGLAAGAGRVDRETARLALLLGGGVAAAVLLVGAGFFAALAALALGALAGLGMAALAERKIGGHTGDVLGAAQQVVEAAVLLAVAAAI